MMYYSKIKIKRKDKVACYWVADPKNWGQLAYSILHEYDTILEDPNIKDAKQQRSDKVADKILKLF